MDAFLLADDLHFGLEFDAALAERGFLDLVDDGQHIRRGGAAIIDDEIAVDLGDLGTADARALEAQLVDEFARGALLGVLEDAAGAGFARLGGAAFLHGSVEQLLDLLRGARLADERCGYRVILLQRAAVAVVDVHLRRGLHVEIPVRIDEAHADDLAERFAAHRAGIHAQSAADVAGNAFEPFEAADLGIARGVGEFLLLHADTRVDFAVADFDLFELAARQVYHDAANTAIAHEQVRPADRNEERDFVELAKVHEARDSLLRPRPGPTLR